VVLQASAEERALPTAAARPLLTPRWRVTTAQAWPVPQTSAVLVPGHSLQLVPVMSRAVVMRAAATPAVRQMMAAVRNPPVVRFSCTPPPEQQRA